MDQGRGIFSFLEQSCKQLTSEYQVKIVKNSEAVSCEEHVKFTLFLFYKYLINLCFCLNSFTPSFKNKFRCIFDKNKIQNLYRPSIN